jgi:AIPR protein
VDRARVQVRFIAVPDGPLDLRDAITKATNTQNRINRQDFVSLDPEQQRLKTELAIDGFTYNFKSSEATIRDNTNTDLEEATIALACANADLAYSTLAKREIGRLWEDTSKAPYKALFNPSVTGVKLWRCTQLMRYIDKALSIRQKKSTGCSEGFLVHGNRFIAHQVFHRSPIHWQTGASILPEETEQVIADHVEDVSVALETEADAHFPQSYLAQLFKNQNKLAEISNAMRGQSTTKAQQFLPLFPNLTD